MTNRDRGTLILIWVVAACILSLIVLYVCSEAEAQRGPGGCSVGVQGPWGGVVGARAGGGCGIQAGVLGPHGGVVGAQVGGGRGVAVGVLPPARPPAVPAPTHNGWRGPTPENGQAPALTKGWSPLHLCRLGKDGITFVGSGVLIAGTRGAVAFASHQLHPGDNETRLIVRTADGVLHWATRGPADPANDVALLVISGVDMHAGVEVAQSVSIGQEVTLHGWPMGKGPAVVRGVVAERSTITGSNRNGQYHRTVGGEGAMVVVRFPRRIEGGESGGPIIDSNGQLVGILSGHDGTACGPEAIQRLLLRLGDNPSPDYKPPRPVVQITREEFDLHSESIGSLTQYVNGQTKLNQEIQNRLMAHSEAIASIKVQIGSGALQGPPGLTGNDGRDGTDADPAALQGLEQRVTALEAANESPLFYHQSFVAVLDADGNVVDKIEIQPRTPVLRGGTLRYTGIPREGAVTDSFRVDVED